MELELAAKILALLVGVLGLPKLWSEIADRRRSLLKDQLATAKDLANSVDSGANGLVMQSAYAALTGKRPLHPRDIQRLMRLEEPLRAFTAFHLGQNFLLRTTGRRMPFRFKDRYRSPKRRKALLVCFSSLYFTSAISAFAPLLFANQIFGSIGIYTMLGLLSWAVAIGWVAKTALGRFEGLMAAQRLLKIRAARPNNSSKPPPLRGAA